MKPHILPQFFGKQVEVAYDRHEQVIEITRYATNKLTQRLSCRPFCLSRPS
jgi:hypothetical protein